MRYRLGIDIGGTTTHLLAVNDTGRKLGQLAHPTNDEDDPHWYAAIAAEARSFDAEFEGRPESIGLAAPGIARPDGTAISWMPGRLNGLEGLDWTQQIALGVPVRVLNDAQAALLGEVWQGAAHGARNAVLLTLGTGVGGAILCDGRLLRGEIGRVGHLGHVSLDPHGEKDITGAPGSLEDAFGECTLEKRSAGRFTSTETLLAAVAEDDRDAARVWDEAVMKLAAGIVSIINAVDPETVILGGGIARAGATLLDPLRDHLDQWEWRPGGHRTKLVLAQLGDLAGAYGAAYYARSFAELS